MYVYVRLFALSVHHASHLEAVFEVSPQVKVNPLVTPSVRGAPTDVKVNN